jgi:ketosteroid isomerase-like protein
VRALTVIFLAAVLFVVNSCSRRAFDAATEEAKLLRRDSEWAEAASSGTDIEKILSYWTDDALIFPGQPILEGKAAIRPYVASSLNTPGFKIHWVSSKPVFSPDGKMAYMPATTELTVAGPDSALIKKRFEESLFGGSSPMGSGAAWWILRMSTNNRSAKPSLE